MRTPVLLARLDWSVALLGICWLLASACDSLPLFAKVPPAVDEALIRSELHVPTGASLRSMDALPAATGTFGREGLRIVATFDVPAAERGAVATALRGAGWSEAVLPDLSSLRAPPSELPEVSEGLSFCLVGVHSVGTTFTAHACSTRPEQFDRYRVGVYDRSSGVLSLVLKNYY